MSSTQRLVLDQVEGLALVVSRIDLPSNSKGKLSGGPVQIGPYLFDVFHCKGEGFDLRVRGFSDGTKRFYHVGLDQADGE